MSLFPPIDDNALYFSMTDRDSFCSRHETKPFFLDEAEWQTIEHYYQAMKFDDPSYKEKIRVTESIQQVEKLGKSMFKRKRSDWKKVQTTVMTRAVYTQCKTYPEIAENLLETGEQLLVENSQFDYFWGCGRDRRGENHYGKVLMNVRNKLREEQSDQQSSR